LSRNYFKNFLYYFPKGKFWNFSKNGNFYKFLTILSKNFENLDFTVENFIESMSPYLADTYWIENWEKILQIPDDIFYLSDSIEQRRQFVLSKLFLRKLFTNNDYLYLASILGLDIEISTGYVAVSTLPFTLPQTLTDNIDDIPFICYIAFKNISSSTLPKILPFKLKDDKTNDEIFKKICLKYKPVFSDFKFIYS